VNREAPFSDAFRRLNQMIYGRHNWFLRFDG
jgi:hypothetical protein